jgi:Domain of unknown function (DUF4258)
MHTTRHLRQRMSQRGVSREMVDLVLEHGIVDQDEYILGRRTALELLDDYQRRLKVLKKILDKGGVTVVSDAGNLITTYNFTGGGH